MINEVRNAVLSILNKNNYGYISPSDFNLYAKNAQMEIYEDYFSSYNKVINAENQRNSGTDYADIESPIAETLETFLVTNNLTKDSSNKFYYPSLTTTGDESYYLLKLLCYPKVLVSGTQSGAEVVNSLIDSTKNFSTYGLVPGDVVVNTTTKLSSTYVSLTSNTQILLSSNIFPVAGATNDGYAIFKASSLTEADKVSAGKITILNSSNLTAPSIEFPSYVYQGNSVYLYPPTIEYQNQVLATYFKYPKVPKWTYISLVDGSPAFDQSQSDYQDFELPLEDEYRLVTKILEYCGMSIRETQVTQFAMAQQAGEPSKFSIQQ
jgi:hypothetical protein